MPEIQTQTTATTAATPTAPTAKKSSGLTFRRFFTKPGVSPYDEIEWELRLAQITDSKGGIIFEQKDVEVPKDWSMTATNIVASKYLHGKLGTPKRETGVRQLVSRVAETIRDWGLAQGYFRTPEDGATFHDELAHHPRPPVRGFQFARMVQRRLRPHRAQLRRPATGTGTQRSAASNSASPATKSRSAPPASSTRCRIRSTPSLRSPRPKACSSSGDQAPAPIFLRCVRRLKPLAAAAPPAARSAS